MHALIKRIIPDIVTLGKNKVGYKHLITVYVYNLYKYYKAVLRFLTVYAASATGILSYSEHKNSSRSDTMYSTSSNSVR